MGDLSRVFSMRHIRQDIIQAHRCFFASRKGNDICSLLVTEILAGWVGNPARVTTAEAADSGSKRSICVHTKDFDDLEEVRKLLQRLTELIKSRGLMIRTGELHYMPETYSDLGIQRRNKWGLRSSFTHGKPSQPASLKDRSSTRKMVPTRCRRVPITSCILLPRFGGSFHTDILIPIEA